jgi:pimeloyl-ACP methyl ester carboxylesterase
MSEAGVRDIEVVVQGVRSPGIAAGPDEAREAAVFVHGNPGSARDWQDLVSRVGQFGRAVALDMPAFGAADRPRRFDHSSFGYAAHLGGAIAELGIDRVHLVVHDFGGPWGLVWAAGAPEALSSAVLIDSGFLRGYRWHPMARRWRTPVLGELIQMATTRRLWRHFLNEGGGRPLPDDFVDRLYDHLDRGQKRAVLELYRATDKPDLLLELLGPQFRELDRPALVVWGRHDPFLPVEQAVNNREGFPRADIVVLEESGHFPFADDPEGTAAAVVPFLREQME